MVILMLGEFILDLSRMKIYQFLSKKFNSNYTSEKTFLQLELVNSHEII